MAKTKKTEQVWRPEPVAKRTKIGHGKNKMSSMNKHERRSYKKYRGQG